MKKVKIRLATKISAMSFSKIKTILLVFIVISISALDSKGQVCSFTEVDFANGGTFGETCTLAIGDVMDITGSVTWTGGVLTLTGDDGRIDIQNGALLDITSGSIIMEGVNGDIDIESGGTLNVDEGASFTSTDEIDIAGTLNVSGNVVAGGYIDVENGATANISSTGDLSTGGNIEVKTGGSMDISGIVTSGTNFELDGGTVTVNDEAVLNASDGLYIDRNSTLDINNGAIVNVTGNLENNSPFGGGDGQATITIDGTMNVSGDLIVTATGGSIINGSGILDVEGTYSDGTGGDFASNCSVFPCTPGIVIQNAPTSVNDNAEFIVTFEWLNDVTGFTIEDIGITNATLDNFIEVDGVPGDTYTVGVTPDGNGDITISLGENEVEEGNNEAIPVTVFYDLTGPTISFSNVPDAVTAEEFNITIQFNEDVQLFIDTDISVSGATRGALTTVDASSYTLAISTATTDVVVSIAASVLEDLAGNDNEASEVLTIPYSATIRPGDVANLSLWLDPEYNVTLTSGGYVSSWGDREPNIGTDDATAVVDERPFYYEDALNGHAALGFDGVDDKMDGAGGFYPNEYFIVTIPSEIYNTSTATGTVLGFFPTDFGRLALGNGTAMIANELFVHGTRDTGYRAAYINAAGDVNLNQPVLINSRQNGAGDGQDLYFNGLYIDPADNTLYDEAQDAQYTSDNAHLWADEPYEIADEDGETPVNPYNGKVAEILSYSSVLNASDRRDVETYLAIKFGITLDVTAGGYTVGGTTIYNDATYSNDIGVLAYDLSAGLNQTSSKSVNPGSLLTISDPSDMDDNEYFFFGNNGVANTFKQDAGEVPPGNSDILEKVWTVSTSGGDGIGTVSVSFDITSLAIDLNNSTINLVILGAGSDPDTDFDTGVLNNSGVVTSVNGRDIVTFENVDFTDGDFFTITGDIQTASPGGSGASLGLWLKADEGATSSNGLITVWSDQSGNGNDVAQGTSSFQPTLVPNVLNYNDGVYFNSDYIEHTSGAYTQDYFIVLKPDNAIDNTSVNGYVMGFNTLFDDGFYVGDQNIVGGDLFGQYLDEDNFESAATGSAIADDNIVIINSRNNAGATAQEYFANGTAFTPTENGTFTNITDNSAIRLGNNFDGDNAYEGYIGEILMFSSRLDDAGRRDVESYLAIKYGVTLGDGLSNTEDYTSGGTVIYDNTTSHAADIAGIGQLLDYGLNQQTSMSVNDGAIIKMESPSDLDDEEFLIWGYDGSGSKTAPNSTDLELALFEERLPAEWRVQMTGDVGTVTVKMYVGGIDNFSDRPQTASLYEIIISNGDDTFDPVSSSIAASTLSNDTLTFDNVTFTDGDYFTLSLASSPVVAGMNLWLRADREAEEGLANDAEDSDAVRFWNDQSGTGNDFSQATIGSRPTFNSNAINGNPAITFDDGSTFLSMTSAANVNPGSIYIIYNDASTDPNTTPFTNDDNDDGLGIGYGGTTNLFDGTNTPADVRTGANYVNGTDIGDGTSQTRPGATTELHSRVFTSNLSNASWNYFVGNDRGNAGTSIGGDVAEIMSYTALHTDTERRDVETYLAIKYGITLDISSMDYTYNGGTDLYSNTTYPNNIAGIGSNSDFGLSQASSSSINTGAIVTISNPSNLNSGHFLIWGTDNANTDEINVVVPPGIGDRMTKQWGITQTNDIGTVTVQLDLTGLSDYSSKTAADFTLLVDNDPNLDADLLNTYIAQSYTSNIVTFTGVDFTSATHFGLGSSVDLNGDTDNDGVPDFYETANGTDPNDSDDPVAGGAGPSDINGTTGTLGDGISDALENILIANGAQSPVTVFTDSDNDGIPDYLEVANGTDPFDLNSPTTNGSEDSDGDGIPDGLEILIASEGGTADPALDSDLDADGIPDYYEVINGTNPNDVNAPVATGGGDTNDGTGSSGDNITDALEQILIDGGASGPIEETTDSDGDGIPDYVEAQTFTDPFNSASPVSVNNTLRSLQADYEASGGACIDLDGFQWIDVEDPSGNLVFSINPFGNNLGSTCWGVRVVAGAGNVRIDADTYFINRGWYIEPTIQPTGTAYVRLYVSDSETTDLTDKINLDQGLTETTSSILNQLDVLKVSIAGIEDLDPIDTEGGTITRLNPTIGDFAAASADVLTLGLTSFSSLDPEIEDVNALPVDLISFTGEISNRNVMLNWATATEIDNDRFEIERSIDGDTFEVIGMVSGNGNSNQLNNYSFLDNRAHRGISYYRLVQYDFDGEFEIFNSIRIDNTDQENDFSFSFYPNPSQSSNINIRLSTGNETSPIQLTIYNLSGKIVHQEILKPVFGISDYQIRPKGYLTTGIYQAVIQQEGNQLTRKISLN
ncbi:MAG: T9SS type A sorting domain-containing protein [Reichenbachiella sp.]